MQKPGPDGAAGTARPLSVAPAQWDECPLLVNFCSNVPRGRKAKEGEKRRKLPGAGRTKIKKDGPEKGAATSRPPPRYRRCRLAGFAFLDKRQCGDEVWMARGGGFISR